MDTIDEYDRFISWLKLLPGDHALEVASGSGGPARYLGCKTNCHVTGIDANESGVKTADPVVITGPVTNDELALRSSVGLFLCVGSFIK